MPVTPGLYRHMIYKKYMQKRGKIMDIPIIISQKARIAAEIKIAPQVSIGEIETCCVGEPVMQECCPDTDGCAYMVSQLVCVRFPLCIQAAVEAKAGIACCEADIGRCCDEAACCTDSGEIRCDSQSSCATSGGCADVLPLMILLMARAAQKELSEQTPTVEKPPERHRRHKSRGRRKRREADKRK